MGEFEITSKCLVVAATMAERSNCVTRIELTPWDFHFFKSGPIQKGLLFLKPNNHHNNNLKSNSINHLKTTLSSTLDFYPPLAGRFVTENNDDDTVSVFVECNNAGAEFVEAKAAEVKVSDILNQSQGLKCFFPLNGTVNCDGTRVPLMSVQITELVDGYFIGCTMNHTLADGTSFWNFFNSWSEISRGFRYPSRTPLLDRWFPDNITPPNHLPLGNDEKEKSSIHVFTPVSFPERVVHLSKQSISELKSKANFELQGENSISSLQSYMAHLWRGVTRNRNLKSNEEVHLFVIIGMRSRIPLPEQYWGNAIYTRTVTARAGELLGKGLGWAATQINELVRKQTREEAMKHYMDWIESPVLGVPKLPPNSLLISSSPRFDVYGTDFGWGAPVAVRSGAGNKFDGKVTLFPGADEGSVDMELCLHPNTLLGLENDPEFLEFVTFTRHANK